MRFLTAIYTGYDYSFDLTELMRTIPKRVNGDHWSEVIADPVIADAIRDRLQHSALTINITGESYRGVKARKLASKKKDE